MVGSPVALFVFTRAWSPPSSHCHYQFRSSKLSAATEFGSRKPKLLVVGGVGTIAEPYIIFVIVFIIVFIIIIVFVTVLFWWTNIDIHRFRHMSSHVADLSTSPSTSSCVFMSLMLPWTSSLCLVIIMDVVIIDVVVPCYVIDVPVIDVIGCCRVLSLSSTSLPSAL